ncbi:MAG: FAD-dependent oxidoreductase [Steroidobacteraceae bacterium]
MSLGRRDFIKNTVVAGLATTLAGTSLATQSRISPKRKVIVAGAGISGLCCAYELMKKGHEVVVLEASGRHGGHVFTGRDGLSDGLYADFGADHITQPGYERLFAYVREFGLSAIPYPNAEGSAAAPDAHRLKMISGKFYTEEMLADPAVLKSLGFSAREAAFLSAHPWHELSGMFLKPLLGKFTDEFQPFGVGYDELDKISMADFYRQRGASKAALGYLGGEDQSALFGLWGYAVMGMRGIPLSEGDTYHLKGGNQELPTAFARRLGDRVKLKHPILAIMRNESGVTVTYKAYDHAEERQMSADLLVNCIPLTLFRNIPVTPALSPEKQYVVDNMTYSSHPFFVFEASSKFWLDDGFKSINMEFEHPDISSIWQETNEVDTKRIILKAYAPGGVSAQRGLAAFREVYPGKHDTIVQALSVDWTRDKYCPTCEMLPFPLGEMHRFWPQILEPDGRIYFAGTYADPLSRGMESCIRSAQRVAVEIDRLASSAA